MKTIILAGGYGTRIRDVSESLPKPMIPIGGYPILWHIMKHYSHWGHKEFILCLGYKGASIKEFFLNYEAQTRDFTISLGHERKLVYHSQHSEDWSVTLADTGLNSMTGARIRRIKQYIGNDQTFFMTYGDAVSNVDLEALLQFHNSHGRTLTITGVSPPGRFGELDVDASGRISAFNEKPQVSGGCISGGFFVCRRDVFDYLDDREDLVFEKDPMDRLVESGQVMVFKHTGFWHPMDTSRDFNLLNGFWNSGQAPWIVK